jgi:hypothetical protein
LRAERAAEGVVWMLGCLGGEAVELGESGRAFGDWIGQRVGRK